jgi:hypothetical protein
MSWDDSADYLVMEDDGGTPQRITTENIDSMRSENDVEGFIFDADNTGSMTTTGSITAGAVTVDNLNLNDNTLSSSSGTVTIQSANNQNIVLDSQGSGFITTGNNALVANTVIATHLTVQGQDAFIGDDGLGDSILYFYDDDSNTWRSLYWNDAGDGFFIQNDASVVSQVVTQFFPETIFLQSSSDLSVSDGYVEICDGGMSCVSGLGDGDLGVEGDILGAQRYAKYTGVFYGNPTQGIICTNPMVQVVDYSSMLYYGSYSTDPGGDGPSYIRFDYEGSRLNLYFDVPGRFVEGNYDVTLYYRVSSNDGCLRGIACYRYWVTQESESCSSGGTFGTEPDNYQFDIAWSTTGSEQWDDVTWNFDSNSADPYFDSYIIAGRPFSLSLDFESDGSDCEGSTDNGYIDIYRIDVGFYEWVDS